MLLAGGQGSRLYCLTQDTAKPAVPFGGKYRIIDFPLSNCVNSGIDTVGVLTQYQPLELNDYIGNGQPWDLNRNWGGAHILPPYTQSKTESWYKGTANAIYQNIPFVDRYNPEYVVILSGDHIYKMDYNKMLKFHKEKGSECTIAVMPVSMEEATRMGIMSADENGAITDFEEKPKNPKSNLASMGVYIFTWSALKQYLIDDEADPNSENDFLLPGLRPKLRLPRHPHRRGRPGDQLLRGRGLHRPGQRGALRAVHRLRGGGGRHRHRRGDYAQHQGVPGRQHQLRHRGRGLCH